MRDLKKNLSSVFCKVLSVICLLNVGYSGWAQVSISSFPWSQPTSDGFTNSATLPTGFTIYQNSSSALSSSADAILTGTVSSSQAGNSYVFYYSTTPASSSIGFVPTGSFSPGSPSIKLIFKNTTGSTITSLNVSVDYRKLRTASARTETFTLTGSSGTVPSSLNYTYTADGSLASGTVPGTVATCTGTITGLSIANNATYTLSWALTGAGSSGHAVGLGNIQLSLPAASTDATLSNMTISSGTLSPIFASATTSYTASVTNATSSITVTPTHNQANSTIQVRVNGGTYASVTSGTASGSLALNVGTNTIDVLVTAQDGSTTKTYTTTVTRISNDASLSNMTISSGTLSPAFASATTSYTASVTNAVSSVTVTPTVTQANATIQVRVNGGTYASVTSGTASGSLALNVGTNTIDVLVTAQDGTTTKTYTTTVTRASAGCITPADPTGTITLTNNCGNTVLHHASATYFWQGTNAAGTDYTQPTSSDYTATTGTTYYVRAYNSASGGCWSTNSQSISVSVYTVPTIPSCSTPSTVCAGNSVTITGAGSTGATAYTYWDAATGGNAITTSTTPPGTVSSNNLTTPTTLSGGSYIYYVQGENTNCVSASRQSVTVTLNSVPADPAGTVTPGANPACTSTTLAYSSPSGSIYWETATNGILTNKPTTTAYPLSSTGTIYARAYNGSCWSSGTVNSGAVTINTATGITTSPSSTSVATPNTATFTVVGSGTISGYQWQYNDGTNGWLNVTNGSPYSGATSATLTINPTATTLSGYQYRCIVKGTSPCSDATSSAATLTVTTTPWEDFENGSKSAYADANVTCTAGNWDFNLALLGSSANDFFNGTQSARVETNGDIAMNFNLTNGVGTVTLLHGAYGSDANSNWRLEASTNNGSTWTAFVSSTYTATSSTFASQTITVNLSGNVRFRLVNLETSGTHRINFDDIYYTTYSGCSSPNALAFVSQPSTVVQDLTMSTVTVKAYCSSTGFTASGYTGNITLTVSGGGCGYTSQTVAAVAGIATFSSITFDRSVQTGITLTATASGLGNAVSSTFNVTAPSGTAGNTTIVNENFDGSTPSWGYTTSTVSDNTTFGSPYVGSKDYTTNPYGNSSFKKSLVKSHTLNNNSSQGEGTSQILFNNITGLGVYNSVQVSFLIASLPSQSSGASGNGTDENENVVIESSLDGGTSWSTVLTYYGSSNYLLPLSTSSPATLAYNANASYNANHANTSTQSAFVINLPSATSQFRLRMTATDNREEENWAIDNIQIVGTILSTGVQKALPTATGNSYSTCSSVGTPIAVALANTQGTTSYAWSPTTNISSTTSAGPTVTVSTATTYTVTATDADGCTATASDAISITTPTGSITLPTTSVSAIEPSCPDATGWTYYTDPSDLTKWLFGIYKNGNTFTANVDITVKTSANTAYDTKQDATNKKATFTMGRYWNAIVASGSISSSNPIKVRFFYDQSDISTMTTDAQALATAYGGTAHAVEWFKTTTSHTYDPTNNTTTDVPNKLSYSTFTTSQGTLNSIAYTEYDGLTGFSGGTGGIRVSPTGVGLPVEFLYLTATPVNNSYVRLNWATVSEINNKGFEVQRSSDGVTFETIGWVDGHGNSNSLIEYSYDDKTAVPNAIYYYRLNQIDMDNDTDLSNIVSAMLVGENGFVMESLKPNPASSQVIVNVITDDAQAVNISVTDMIGREVLAQPWQLNAGLNGTPLDISALSQGVYHVTVRSLNSYFTKTLAITR